MIVALYLGFFFSSDCRACFHISCFHDKSCPKCARLQKRKKLQEDINLWILLHVPHCILKLCKSCQSSWTVQLLTCIICCNFVKRKWIYFSYCLMLYIAFPLSNKHCNVNVRRANHYYVHILNGYRESGLIWVPENVWKHTAGIWTLKLICTYYSYSLTIQNATTSQIMERI